MACTIVPYASEWEEAWLRCRVLAFLHSAYYDDVRKEKDGYLHPAIELIALTERGELVGLLDAECDDAPGSAASPGSSRGAVIWNVAVHPDWQRHGIGSQLLLAVLSQLRAEGIERVEAWTRDDPGVMAWYQRHGFQSVERYHHIYLVKEEQCGVIGTCLPGLRPIQTFAHFTGETLPKELARAQHRHVCQRFERLV